MSSSLRASFAHTNIHALASLLPPHPSFQHQASVPVKVSTGRIYLSSKKPQLRRFCAIDSHNPANESSDSISSSRECKAGKDESHQRGSLTPNEILERLKRYGIAGILSYGLLNTAYYLTTFLVVWFYVAPAPGRMGYLAAVERFVKVMAMVWAGSQVTKLLRAGGALALAPLVDQALSWFTIKFKFETQGKAFMAIAGFCFLLAFLLFLLVTLLST